MNKIAIVIVTYNVSELLEIQLDLINKNSLDKDYDIIICDNSPNQKKSNEIKDICERNNIRFEKVNFVNSWSSRSHAMVLNYIYKEIKDKYEYFLFLDHDTFTVKNFSITEILKDYIFAGPKLVMNNKPYIHIGCGFIKKNSFNLDFMPELDTGSKLKEFCNETNTNFFDCEKVRNFEGVEKIKGDKMRPFYDSFMDHTFIHLMNISNWSKTRKEDVDNRLNIFINLLNKIK